MVDVIVDDATPLADRLTSALDAGAHELDRLPLHEPLEDPGRRDRFLTLHQIYRLHTAPLEIVGERVRWQHHPAVAAVKNDLESRWIAELDQDTRSLVEPGHTVEAMRRLAARDRSPDIYRWVATGAMWPELLHFLALEGGPDDVFDDLVAQCQVGLPPGPAKIELANNYWDELGNGDVDKVHNVLYQRFVEAVDLPRIPLERQPVAALERSAMLGMVATNRYLQPEMIGALGLIELEAGPHCRYVDRGLERLGASDRAREFYRMHAVVDPVHGQGWLENAVGPLVEQLPAWGPRILRGARWKSQVNRRFFDWAQQTIVPAAA